MKVNAAGLVNGAFKVTGDPPQEFEITNVPVVGGFEKMTEPPVISYFNEVALHVGAIKEIPDIEQGKAHDTGAV